MTKLSGISTNARPHSVFCFKIPRYMDDGSVRLRPLRISDIPFIHTGLRDEDIMKSLGPSRPLVGSWFHLWWSLRKSLMFRYAVEADSSLIGFAGLFYVLPGKSAELTLMITDEKNRRLGYGSRAFNLIAQALEKYSSVEELIVRVTSDNEAALSFWSRLGLEKQDTPGNMQIITITINLRHKESQ